jgi:hypothetical protein
MEKISPVRAQLVSTDDHLSSSLWAFRITVWPDNESNTSKVPLARS